MPGALTWLLWTGRPHSESARGLGAHPQDGGVELSRLRDPELPLTSVLQRRRLTRPWAPYAVSLGLLAVILSADPCIMSIDVPLGVSTPSR